MKKLLIKLLAALSLTALITGCPSSDPQKQAVDQEKKTEAPAPNLTKIKVGDLRSEFWLPIYVAQENGYFKEQGLDAELVMFKDGPVELQSALNGEIDFAVLSTEPILIAYEKGLKSTILMSTLKNKPFMLVANGEIKTVEELKGKKIAAGTPGSSPYAFIRSILKKHGLDPQKDVDLINMDYGASLVALDKGQIQATFLDSTRINQENIKNINILIDTANPETHKAIYNTDKYEASVVVASQSFVAKNKETTQKFATAMYKAIKWQQEHSDEEIAKLVQPYFSSLDMVDIIKLTRSSLSKDGMISQEGYQAMENFALTEGLIKTKIPFKDIIDLSFIENAQKEIK